MPTPRLEADDPRLIAALAAYNRLHSYTLVAREMGAPYSSVERWVKAARAWECATRSSAGGHGVRAGYGVGQGRLD